MDSQQGSEKVIRGGQSLSKASLSRVGEAALGELTWKYRGQGAKVRRGKVERA